MSAQGGFAIPGQGVLLNTTEREITWGGDAEKGMCMFRDAIVSGASRDTTNTPTTHLRRGLVLGIITASGKYAQYDPAATDGTQVARAILWLDLRAQDFDATNQDRVVTILISGPVLASNLIGLDQQARNHLNRQFLFDDNLLAPRNAFPVIEAKTANYTVVAADSGKIFTNQGAAGAVTFTLPTLARGLSFRFFAEVAQNLIVATPGLNDTLVVFNDNQADSVAVQTAGQIIGTSFEIVANADATRWLCITSLGSITAGLTIAT